MTDRRLSHLVRIAELHLERRLEGLARIERAAAALRKEAEDLGTRGRTPPPALDSPAPAAAAMAASLWEGWRNARIADLGLQEADLSPARAAERAQAARAHGRLLVLRRLMERHGR